MLTLLRAMQQADTAFPSGAFAFSNGVEGLVDADTRFDAEALRRITEATLRHRWASMDRVALILAFRATGHIDRLASIDGAVESATLVEPFRTGSKRSGQALLASHIRLGTPGSDALQSAIRRGQFLGHLPVVQGRLWQALGLAEDQAVAISGYQTVSGLASAAVRLGVVGALDAQTVLRDMMPVIDACAGAPVPDDAQALSSFVPMVEIATMRSAQGHSRLFAN